MPQNPKETQYRLPHLAWWKGQLGSHTLADVTPAMISECKERITNGMRTDGSMFVTVKGELTGQWNGAHLQRWYVTLPP